MALVLTRNAGESIRLMEAEDKPAFKLKVLEVRPNGVYVSMIWGALIGEAHIDFDTPKTLFDGTIKFYKGFRGHGQVRCVFEMPEHINIVRTELLK